MAKGPRTAGKLVFRGFHFISEDEGENVEVRLRVRGIDNGLYSTDPVKSIWEQDGMFLANIADHCYWLQLSKYDNVRKMQENAIAKVKEFLKDDEFPAQNIWMMQGTVRGKRENERFYYVG